jgi:dCMP deaminase
MNRWDKYFFDLCERNAQMSKDPSTQVGAVIVRPDRTIAAMGWNGFPRGVSDQAGRYSDKPTKYKMVVHAECNAILSAKEQLHGYVLYVSPLHPCADCAGIIIQSGIKEVAYRTQPRADWAEHFAIAATMFQEAGVYVREF